MAKELIAKGKMTVTPMPGSESCLLKWKAHFHSGIPVYVHARVTLKTEQSKLCATLKKRNANGASFYRNVALSSDNVEKLEFLLSVEEALGIRFTETVQAAHDAKPA